MSIPYFMKGQGEKIGVSFFGERYNTSREALAVVVIFNIVVRVRVHSGPIVAYSKFLISKAASLRMVDTLTLMKFC